MSKKKTNKATRGDGWGNVFSGLSGVQDPATSTKYTTDFKLGEAELRAIFVGDGLGRKIIEMPGEEMTRKWLTIDGDEGGGICDAMEVLSVQQILTDAVVWARLFGGSAIVRLLYDGGNLESPVNYDTLKKIIGYRVFDRHRITWTTADLETDQLNPRYGEPTLYTVSPVNLPSFKIHHSRICIIDGKRLPDVERQMNQGWGLSILQGAYSHLMRVGSTLGYSAGIVRDFVQAVLSVNGLSDMLASGREDEVKARIKILDLSRSILNTMIIDADGESYSKQASSVAGLGDLLDRFAEGLCSATGIPMTKLFGRSPAGMNATGESDIRNYYDTLQAEQTGKLSPVMEVIVRDIYKSKEGPTKGVEPENWSIKWSPLWQMTEEQEATYRKIVAETDQIYINSGVLTAEEVAESRFGSGEWSIETHLIEIEETELPETSDDIVPGETELPETSDDIIPGEEDDRSTDPE